MVYIYTSQSLGEKKKKKKSQTTTPTTRIAWFAVCACVFSDIIIIYIYTTTCAAPYNVHLNVRSFGNGTHMENFAHIFRDDWHVHNNLQIKNRGRKSRRRGNFQRCCHLLLQNSVAAANDPTIINRFRVQCRGDFRDSAKALQTSGREYYSLIQIQIFCKKKITLVDELLSYAAIRQFRIYYTVYVIFVRGNNSLRM